MSGTAAGISHHAVMSECASAAVAPIAIATSAATRQSSPTTKSHQKRPKRASHFTPLPPPAARCLSSRTNSRERTMTKPSTPRIAASEPGQCAPAPSVDQKIPKVVSITPTLNFMRFSGTRASGARTAKPTTCDEDEGGNGSGRGERDRALRATEREDDEHDLEPLEQHALEREDEAVPVEAGPLDVRGALRVGELAREDRVLVVQRLEAARTEDRLPQPLQPEDEEQSADDEPQRVERNRGQRRPEHGRDRGERERRGADSCERRAPAARERRGKHDRERLHHLDGAGEECGKEKECVTSGQCSRFRRRPSRHLRSLMNSVEPTFM